MNAQAQFVIALGTVSMLISVFIGEYGIGVGLGAVSLTCGLLMECLDRLHQQAESDGGAGE